MLFLINENVTCEMDFIKAKDMYNSDAIFKHPILTRLLDPGVVYSPQSGKVVCLIPGQVTLLKFLIPTSSPNTGYL